MSISHAQNFEDVVLWRALGDIERGFYIDVGAQDPTVSSVSLAFYEKGWRGVHVEPSRQYAAALRAARPDETVLEVAIGRGDRVMSLHEVCDSGLSTGEPEIAKRAAQAGFVSHEIDVPTLSLGALLSRFADRDIHWLKIDVEGMEADVLSSWGECEVRPWIVVVEAVMPLGREPTHSEWEPSLIDRAYAFSYQDGLNRFYVAAAHSERARALVDPPNVFDDWHLSGSSGNPFAALLEQTARRFETEASAAHSETALLKLKLGERCAELEDALLNEQRGRVLESLASATQCDGLRHRTALLEQEIGAAQAAQAALEDRFRETLGIQAGHLADLRRELDERMVERGDAMKVAARAASALQRLQADLDQAKAEQTATVADRHRLEADLASAHGEVAMVKRSRLWRLGQALHGGRSQPNLAGGRPPDVKLETLLRLDLADFVRAAYEVVLRRQPDPVGEASYMDVLRAGRCREDVLTDMLLSPEGIATGASIMGMERHLLRRRLIDRLHPLRSRERARKTQLAFNTEVLAAATHTAEASLIPAATTHRKETLLLSELLTLHDLAFVRAAYRLILDRDPDPEGEMAYARLLRQGHDKMDLLAAMSRSPEARSRGAEVPGLKRALQRRRLSLIPVFGPLASWLTGRRTRLDHEAAFRNQVLGMQQATLDVVTQLLEATREIQNRQLHLEGALGRSGSRPGEVRRFRG